MNDALPLGQGLFAGCGWSITNPWGDGGAQDQSARECEAEHKQRRRGGRNGRDRAPLLQGQAGATAKRARHLKLRMAREALGLSLRSLGRDADDGAQDLSRAIQGAM